MALPSPSSSSKNQASRHQHTSSITTANAVATAAATTPPHTTVYESGSYRFGCYMCKLFWSESRAELLHHMNASCSHRSSSYQTSANAHNIIRSAPLIIHPIATHSTPLPPPSSSSSSSPSSRKRSRDIVPSSMTHTAFTKYHRRPAASSSSSSSSSLRIRRSRMTSMATISKASPLARPHIAGKSSSTRVSSTGPFRCVDCDRVFGFESHWRVHRRVHTGERPFSCIVCKRAFSTASNHRRHLKTHKLSASELEAAIQAAALPKISSAALPMQARSVSATSASYASQTTNGATMAIAVSPMIRSVHM